MTKPKRLNEHSDKVMKKATRVFKPYIVRRPHRECQILFPLCDLDTLVLRVLDIAALSKPEKP